jgi:hypothetical protein
MPPRSHVANASTTVAGETVAMVTGSTTFGGKRKLSTVLETIPGTGSTTVDDTEPVPNNWFVTNDFSIKTKIYWPLDTPGPFRVEDGEDVISFTDSKGRRRRGIFRDPCDGAVPGCHAVKIRSFCT